MDWLLGLDLETPDSDGLFAVPLQDALEEEEDLVRSYTVEEVSLSLSLPELIAVVMLISGIVTISYSYIRFIRREEGVLPDVVHKLCCPFWSVLRWEGFDSDKPLYALLFGCFYSLFFWQPTGAPEETEEVYKVFFGDSVRNKSDLQQTLLPQKRAGDFA